MAFTNWGADRKTLMNTYKTLIRSKLDYEIFIYDSARKSALKKLDPIKTSPILSTLKGAGETLLTARRKTLSASHAIKNTIIPSKLVCRNTFSNR